MADAGDFVANGCIDAQLLFQFATQGVARLLPFFDFSAGELPLEGHGLMLGALANENLPVSDDESGHHAFHHRDSTVAAAAVREGSTQLVKVKANAAMPAGQRNSRVCFPNSGLFTSAYMRAGCTRM